MAQKRKDKAKKRVVVVDPVGQAHIKATFNNIIISMTNGQGQVVSWASAGKMGFKGSKKNTPYAAQMAAEESVPKKEESKPELAILISCVGRKLLLKQRVEEEVEIVEDIFCCV